MLTSCAVPKPTYQYKKTANKPKIQKTINKNFDSIWNKVIDYSSKSFFSIDNFFPTYIISSAILFTLNVVILL